MNRLPVQRAPIVEELRRRREECGWTQVELARRAGVSNQCINHAEAGRNGYTLHTVEALAAAFDLEVCLRPRPRKAVGR